MPKFRILQVKGEIKFDNNNIWKSSCTLGFYDLLWLPLLAWLEAEDLLCQTTRQSVHVIKSKMVVKKKKNGGRIFFFKSHLSTGFFFSSSATEL